MKKSLLLITLASTTLSNAMHVQIKLAPITTTPMQTVQTSLGRISKAGTKESDCIQYGLIENNQPEHNYIERVFHFHPNNNQYCALFNVPAEINGLPARIGFELLNNKDEAENTFKQLESAFNTALQSQK